MSRYDQAELVKDMRWYLNSKIPGASIVIDRLSDSDLKAAIEKSYEGGVARFTEVFGTPVSAPENANIDPRMVAIRELWDILGRKYPIAACHEILRVDQTDDRIYLVIRVIDEEEGSSRLVQKSAKIRRVSFDASTKRQLPDETIEVEDNEWQGETYLASHVTPMTRERYADKFWQHYDCYRPGSNKAPLDGCYGPTRKDSRHKEYLEFKKTMEVTA